MERLARPTVAIWPLLLAVAAASCSTHLGQFWPGRYPHSDRFPATLEAPAPSGLPIPDAPPPAGKEAPFAVTVYPAFIFADQAVRLGCYVPRSYGAGAIRLELVGVMASSKPLDFGQYTLVVEHVPCGTHIAVCSIHTARGVERRSQRLVAKGICNGS